MLSSHTHFRIRYSVIVLQPSFQLFQTRKILFDVSAIMSLKRACQNELENWNASSHDNWQFQLLLCYCCLSICMWGSVELDVATKIDGCYFCKMIRSSSSIFQRNIGAKPRNDIWFHRSVAVPFSVDLILGRSVTKNISWQFCINLIQVCKMVSGGPKTWLFISKTWWLSWNSSLLWHRSQPEHV